MCRLKALSHWQYQDSLHGVQLLSTGGRCNGSVYGPLIFFSEQLLILHAVAPRQYCQQRRQLLSAADINSARVTQSIQPGAAGRLILRAMKHNAE